MGGKLKENKEIEKFLNQNMNNVSLSLIWTWSQLNQKSSKKDHEFGYQKLPQTNNYNIDLFVGPRQIGKFIINESYNIKVSL